MNPKVLAAAETVKTVLETAKAGFTAFNDPANAATVHRLVLEIRVSRFEPDNGVALRNLEYFIPAVITLLDAVKGEPTNDEP